MPPEVAPRTVLTSQSLSRSRFAPALLLTSAVLSVLGGRAVAQSPSAKLAAAIAAAESAGVRVGVVVRDLDARKTWLTQRSRETFIPASNQKLLTAAAFLHALGPEYRFRTGVSVQDGVLRIHAGGDPNWVTGSDYSPAHMFGLLADKLRAAGVTAVRGVECDLAEFGTATRPAGWPMDQKDRSYCAPSAGLVLDAGCYVVEVTAQPGSAHAAISVLSPPGGLPVTGGIRMTTDKKKGGVWGLRHSDDGLHGFGHFWTSGGTREVRASIDDPVRAFERGLRAVLADHGVRIDASVRASEVEDVARFDLETPVGPALTAALSSSSNVHAEMLMRVLGAASESGDGSFEGGGRAMRLTLEDFLGEPLPPGIAIADGSGLSRGNEVTPRFLTDLIEQAVRAEWGTTFVDALAQAGRSGTLERRLRTGTVAGQVRAKTGTIRAVSALSGVVRDRRERLHAFAILMNVRDGERVSARKMRAWQDAIVTAIHMDGRGS